MLGQVISALRASPQAGTSTSELIARLTPGSARFCPHRPGRLQRPDQATPGCERSDGAHPRVANFDEDRPPGPCSGGRPRLPKRPRSAIARAAASPDKTARQRLERHGSTPVVVDTERHPRSASHHCAVRRNIPPASDGADADFRDPEVPRAFESSSLSFRAHVRSNPVSTLPLEGQHGGFSSSPNRRCSLSSA